MKANNGSGNRIERDEWETPQWLFDILHKQYEFNFDCCASSNNSKCDNWSEQDFLDYDDAFIDEVHWMNPPFSKALEMFRHFFKVVNKGVAIYRCDNMETKIWQEIILPNSEWVFIPRGRISYEGMDGPGSRFPSALVGVGVEPPKELKGFSLRITKKT